MCVHATRAGFEASVECANSLFLSAVTVTAAITTPHTIAAPFTSTASIISFIHKSLLTVCELTGTAWDVSSLLHHKTWTAY